MKLLYDQKEIMHAMTPLIPPQPTVKHLWHSSISSPPFFGVEVVHSLDFRMICKKKKRLGWMSHRKNAMFLSRFFLGISAAAATDQPKTKRFPEASKLNFKVECFDVLQRKI